MSEKSKVKKSGRLTRTLHSLVQSIFKIPFVLMGILVTPLLWFCALADSGDERPIGEANDFIKWVWSGLWRPFGN